VFLAKEQAMCVKNYGVERGLARARRFFIQIIRPVTDSMAMTKPAMHTKYDM